MARFSGFRNRETCIVYFWLSNDKSWTQVVSDLSSHAHSAEIHSTFLRRAVIERMPLFEEGKMFREIIDAALEAVDWEEISEKLNPADAVSATRS